MISESEVIRPALRRFRGVQRPHYSGGPRTFTYSYLPGTDLVDSISSGYYERSTYWQSYRRLEDAVETTWNGSLRVKYLYGYDLEGRRLAEKVTGPIATKFNSGWTNGFQMSWTYTTRGEIDVTKTRLLDSSGQPTGAWISTWERDWNWDEVSNRTFEDHVDVQKDRTYSANSLNQYNWYDEDEHQTNFSHDDDGNLTADGTWSYTYDLEDRVVTMTRSGVSLTFTYDYLGRRVRKVASGASCGAPGTYEYVYDGFNLLVIYKNDARFETYTWGLDKTGTLHGAGGVDGLLMMRGGNAVFPVYDARGNVTGYINSDGVLYRAYQFDAFGNPVAFVLDPGVSTRDFVGFASKLTDIDGDPGEDAGLVNFGLRLYQPKHGRFIHRDPIGEAGGENLYAHTWNDPVNRWDYLGMTDLEDAGGRGQDVFLWQTFSQNFDDAYQTTNFSYQYSYIQGAGQAMADHLAELRDTPQGFFRMGGQLFAVNIFGEVLINDNGTARLMTGWSWQRGSSSVDQGEIRGSHTGTVLPAGQNTAFGNGHSVETGPLTVLDLDYSEKLHLPDLRRLPIVQSTGQGFTFERPTDPRPNSISDSGALPGSFFPNNNSISAINPLWDKVLPSLAVAPIAPSLIEIGVVVGPYAIAGGRTAWAGGRAAAKPIQRGSAAAYRWAQMHPDVLANTAAFVGGTAPGHPSGEFWGQLGGISIEVYQRTRLYLDQEIGP